MSHALPIYGQDEIVDLVTKAAEQNLPVLLVGETGTGKSSLVRELGKANKQEVVRFTLTGETTVDEFVGKFTLAAGKTVWQDGVLLQALKAGHWLVVDELNAALPEILFVLHPLLDDDQFVMVPQHDNEKVVPHADFRFFATMNPSDDYAGTKELNKAFLSRFPVVLNVEYPNGEAELKAIAHKFPKLDKDVAQTFVTVAQMVRKLKADNKIMYTLSTRDVLHWATAFSLVEAKNKDEQIAKSFKIAILNRSNGDAPVIVEASTKILRALSDFRAKSGVDDFSVEGINKRLKTIDEATEKNLQSIKALDSRKNEIAKEVIASLVAGKV